MVSSIFSLKPIYKEPMVVLDHSKISYAPHMFLRYSLSQCRAFPYINLNIIIYNPPYPYIPIWSPYTIHIYVIYTYIYIISITIPICITHIIPTCLGSPPQWLVGLYIPLAIVLSSINHHLSYLCSPTWLSFGGPTLYPY